MFEFDPNKTYRLMDVLDHEGNSKVDSRILYRDRVKCIAQNVRIRNYTFDGTQYPVVKMDFVQDDNGRWIYRRLRTSPVSDIICKDDTIEIYTMYSVYILEPAELAPVVYQDDADLIELYLSDEYDRFVKGFYYDEDKVPHELGSYVNTGMFTDTNLIFIPDEFGDFEEFVCRYYIQPQSVEFYNTLYKQQDYSRRILIHNHSDNPMRIEFEGFKGIWTIPPGGKKMIIPYNSTGADEANGKEDNP